MLKDDGFRSLILAIEENPAPADDKMTAEEVAADLFRFAAAMQTEGLARIRVTPLRPHAQYASLAVFIPAYRGNKTLFNCRFSPLDQRVVWLEWHIVTFEPKPGEPDLRPFVPKLLDQLKVATGRSHRVASHERRREPETRCLWLSEPEQRVLFFGAVREFLEEIAALEVQ